MTSPPGVPRESLREAMRGTLATHREWLPGHRIVNPSGNFRCGCARWFDTHDAYMDHFIDAVLGVLAVHVEERWEAAITAAMDDLPNGAVFLSNHLPGAFRAALSEFGLGREVTASKE